MGGQHECVVLFYMRIVSTLFATSTVGLFSPSTYHSRFVSSLGENVWKRRFPSFCARQSDSPHVSSSARVRSLVLFAFIKDKLRLTLLFASSSNE